MFSIARSVLCGLALTTVIGCQRWRVDPQALVTPQPERRRLELWSQRHPLLVHGVRVVGDSVWAVPYWKSPRCDSCALRIARSAIDSVRTRVPDDVRTAIAAGLGAVGLGVTIWFLHELASLKD